MCGAPTVFSLFLFWAQDRALVNRRVIVCPVVNLLKTCAVSRRETTEVEAVVVANAFYNVTPNNLGETCRLLLKVNVRNELNKYRAL